MIKTFGCSFTKYHWNTWADFLLVSNKGKLKNYGIPGASNEIICRNICKNAKSEDTIVVMWSGFDREHSDVYYKKNNFCEGIYKYKRHTLEQLYDRSIEYIWLANKFCTERSIKIFNFLMVILELGETKELQKFKPYLPIEYKKWPIDMASFCLKNTPIGKSIIDQHPSPSQHYKYYEQIVCPILNVNPIKITDENLKKLDDQRE